MAILRVANELDLDELLPVLDSEGRLAADRSGQVGLAKQTAQNIIRYRTGEGRGPNLFDSIKELDSVSYVGPTAFKLLFDVADDAVRGSTDAVALERNQG